MRIFNDTNGCSSLISKAGKKLLTTTAMTAVGFLAVSGTAEAGNDWTDHVVVGGGGSINIDSSVANTTNITQLGHRVKVEGDGDIKTGWTVNLQQDTSSSQYILFDTEADPTRLMGSLNANGQVFIFNRNGVIFGANSHVDVGSIVASSGKLKSTNAELDAGIVKIKSKTSDGDVINRGTITVADAGIAAFVSPTIANHGVINAKMGKVAMAAGKKVTLDLYGDNLVEIAVDNALADGLISNTGTINAKGGTVAISAQIAKDVVDNVINMNGVVNVSSAKVQGGKIILSGGAAGKVSVRGKLKANGKGTDAGSIDVTGENIRVFDTAKVKADAESTEAAGDIIIVADRRITLDAEISAQGLAGTGFIETSAPTAVFGPSASILATDEWLLDPTDITIDNPLASLIEGQLAVGDMTVQTPVGGADEGDIGVYSVIDWSTDKTLKLIAHDDVFFSTGGGINASGGGNFIAEAGDDFRMRVVNNNLLTNGGDVSITTGDEFTLEGGVILAGGGDITINNTEQFEALANSLQTSGNGKITINQNKDVNTHTSTTDASIQNAIDSISNTGTGKNTVNVGAGKWTESIDADVANLVLNGANAGVHGTDAARGPESIIKPNSPGVHITANNVTVDGFKIKGGDNGIFVDGADDATIKNNIIKNSSNDGIHAEDSDGLVIKRNKITKTDGDGIDIEDSNGALIKNNFISDIGDGGDDNGIEVEDSDNAVVVNNTINDIDDDGIDLDGSYDALIEGNKIGLMGSEDNIGDDGIDIEDSEGAIIRDNKIQNTVENGIDVRGSDNTDIINNTIRFAGLNGVYVNPSDYVRILDNTITDVDADGVHVEEGYDIRVRRNTIRRTGDDGIDIKKNDRVRVTGNTVTDTDKRGISIERAKDELENFAVVVKDNIVKDTGKTSIVVDRFTTARIVDNIVRDSDRAGIRAQRGDYARLRRNDVHDTKREGIKALGIDEVEVRRNEIRNTRWDGILVDDFTFAEILLNDVRNTGDDGIQASNGEYLNIYDNLIRKAGFFGEGIHADESGADAIYVTNVGSSEGPVMAASLTPAPILFGFNVEIIGNDINKTYDDGIEVVDSGATWVSDNVITHAGYGETENYGGGDYYGADAIHLRNVKGIPRGLRILDEPIADDAPHRRRTLNGTILRTAEQREATPESMIFPEGAPWDYASVVINNQIRKTADDGIEVVGAKDKSLPTILSLGDGGDGAPMPYPEIESGRTLVAWNDISHVGYGDGGDGDGGSSYGYAPDGYGADAVHVRNIHNGRFIGDGGDGAPIRAPRGDISPFDNDLFAVEVLENYLWNVGDDGVEVRESGATRVANNEIYNTGLATSDIVAPVWISGWDFGANDGDGVHIENVYANSPFGNSIEVLGNIIDHTGDDGVEVHYSGRALVADNAISNSGVGFGHPYSGGDEGYGHDAIHVGGVYDDGYFGDDYSVSILNNVIDTTGDDGVEVHYSGRTLITDNEISHVGYGGDVYYGYGDEDGADGINVMHVSSDDNNMPFSVDIRRNTIDVTADDGIEVAHSGRTLIRNNDLTNIGSPAERRVPTAIAHIYDIYGSDGIHVRDINQNSERSRRADVRIINNRVTDAGDDGIEVLDTDRVVVKLNTVDQAGDDGINILRYSPFAMHRHPEMTSFVRLRRVPSKAVIKDNVVTNSGTAFPEETSEDTFALKRRKIRFGGDGIEVGGFDKIIVEGNNVSDSVENGLLVSGPDNGEVIVSDNTFTDNDIGAHFQSGEIDLTGDSNFFNGGRIGMRFAPAEIYDYYAPSFDAAQAARALPIEPSFASLSLVDNTIGAQTFNGQDELYVELDNGAFFDPGTPTLLNALDSTYQGTPFGTFTPSVDYAGGFPLDVVAFLESKFFHFNDDGSLGLFFFPLLPEIDQEDVFNYFGPNAGSLSGLNVTILGLPGVPGGAPVALNNIAPAAGDTSPEALNAIETAAGGDGGEQSGCWNDALNAAGAGQPSTINYGGSAEDLLNSETNCGS